MNKKEKILRYFRNNPGASRATIAKATGSSQGYVDQVLAGRSRGARDDDARRQAADAAAETAPQTGSETPPRPAPVKPVNEPQSKKSPSPRKRWLFVVVVTVAILIVALLVTGLWLAAVIVVVIVLAIVLVAGGITRSQPQTN